MACSSRSRRSKSVVDIVATKTRLFVLKTRR